MAHQNKKKVLMQIYGKRCMLCSQKYYKNSLTYHYIRPKSHGGKGTLENGALICEECKTEINKYKFLSSQHFDLTLKILNNKICFIEKGN